MRKYAYTLKIVYQRTNKLLTMLSLTKKNLSIYYFYMCDKTYRLTSTKTSINRQILISTRFPVVNVILQLKLKTNYFNKH